MFPCWQEQTKGGSADVDVGVALAVQETIICISVLKLVQIRFSHYYFNFGIVVAMPYQRKFAFEGQSKQVGPK